LKDVVTCARPWSLVTTAVCLNPPTFGGFTRSVMVAELPGWMVPRFQTTVPEQLPWLGVAVVKFTPAALRSSVTTTLVAGAFPVFVTLIVKVSGKLRIGEDCSTFFVIVRFEAAAPFTVVLVWVLLLAGFGSDGLLTLAEFTIVPAFRGVTMIVMIAPWLAGIDANVQVTVPLDWLHCPPPVADTDPKLTPLGRLSVTVTFVAGVLPGFVTVNE
jgi:hypothetical protein